jgi:predicted SAM-dependent methyltransferase
VNVDRHPEMFEGVDLEASVLALPLPDECAEAVYVGHLLEHLGYDDEVRQCLAEVRRVLRPDGLLCVVGPCLHLAEATGQPDWLLDSIRGGEDDGSGLGHRWTPTANLTRAALESAGFAVAELPIERITPPEWPNPTTAPWQCAFLARRA